MRLCLLACAPPLALVHDEHRQKEEEQADPNRQVHLIVRHPNSEGSSRHTAARCYVPPLFRSRWRRIAAAKPQAVREHTLSAYETECGRDSIEPVYTPLISLERMDSEEARHNARERGGRPHLKDNTIQRPTGRSLATGEGTIRRARARLD